MVNGLFKIGQHPSNGRALASYLSNKEAKIQVWYERLGHIGIQKMKELKKMDDKIHFIKNELNHLLVYELLKIIHSDIIGLLSSYLGGSKYFY